MIATTPPVPLQATLAGFRRFSVAEYERLTEIGLLTEDDDLELLDGYLVHKMARNPPHDGTLHQALDALTSHLPGAWRVRIQSAVKLPESMPEPDLAVVRRDAGGYKTRHPTPADIGLVIEVSDSTLDGDRLDKGRIYANAGLPYYWILNLVELQVEEYGSPTATGYADRRDYKPGDAVTLVLDGQAVAEVAVNDMVG